MKDADYLYVVNGFNPIVSDEKSVQKTLIPFMDYDKIYLEKNTAFMLSKLLAACGANKGIIPISGYRTKKEQEEIYRNSIKENGLDFTSKYVAYPNTSEHQTGLAIDVALNKKDIDFLCPDFPDNGICKKFRELAPKHGFILRYPEGKEHITKISHEPWHFRYVGIPYAKIITAKKLCLEEYINLEIGKTRRYLYE